MMNRKILLGLILIFAVVGLVGGLAYAYFSDTGTSSDNVFSTGTLTLKLTDSNESDKDSVTASFGSNTLVPGSCTGDQTLTLKNTGTVNANHVEVHLTNNVTDVNDDASTDMDSYLRIDKLTYDSGSELGQIEDLNYNGYKDLYDWANSTIALNNLSLTDFYEHSLVMNVCLDENAGNSLQGDSVTSTFTVDLNQHSSQ